MWIDLEGKLRLEYAEVAKLKEEFWAMKARILWLVEGDRNTFFYHTSALVLWKRNHIFCSNWLNGEREIAEFINKDSWNFSPRVTPALPWLIGTLLAWNNHPNEEALTTLIIPITDKEISEGLWALKPFKAPSSDCLHAGFSHRFWLVVGEFMRKEVKNIFNSGVILDYLN